MSEVKKYTVALAGNPNAGKTSIFNALTGAHQHVGNYPGVTVEKKEGFYTFRGHQFKVVDLPGTYSLTAFSHEETVTRSFLVEENPDVVVDVLDSTNIERNLYLAIQLMELGFSPVLALNFNDEARFLGQQLDLSLLEERLNTRCVETVGNRGHGAERLREVILEAAQTRRIPPRITFSEEIESSIAELTVFLNEQIAAPYPVRYAATKVLEQDRDVTSHVFSRLSHPEDVRSVVTKTVESLEKLTGDSISVLIGDQRHGVATGLIREATISSPRYDRQSMSDQVDMVLTHRILGLPAFFLFMYILFWLTFSIGETPMGWIESGFGYLERFIESLWGDSTAESPLRSLLVDGLVRGVGGVIVFLPNILLLFLGIAALEDTGYMSRAAFIMDRVMHKIGLHGKSFIPMLIGFGCNVPAIMATRTLDNMRDRLTTMLVLPLMSCGARLPIYLLLIPAFFEPRYHALMLWIIYLIGILLAALGAKVLRLTVLRGENAPFVMELPPYRMPTLKSVMIHMWNRGWLYLQKAGTIILAVSIVMWFFSYYPRKQVFDIDARIQAGEELSSDEIERMRKNERLEYSVAGRVGKALEPIVGLMGFDWKITTAFLGAFAAKEVFVAQMSIVFSMGETEEMQSSIRTELRRQYSPLIGFCVMLFALIATPCMATVIVTRQESGSWKWAFLMFATMTLVAYVLTVSVFQIGSFVIYLLA